MKQQTILVIDDDSDDLFIMNEVIGTVDPDATCLTFREPKAAICELLSNPALVPDFIFIDYNMPLMRGDECLQAIRNVERLRDSKIIMISTSMPPEMAGKLSKAGADHAVQKPGRLADYCELLRNIFSC